MPSMISKGSQMIVSLEAYDSSIRTVAFSTDQAFSLIGKLLCQDAIKGETSRNLTWTEAFSSEAKLSKSVQFRRCLDRDKRWNIPSQISDMFLNHWIISQRRNSLTAAREVMEIPVLLLEMQPELRVYEGLESLYEGKTIKLYACEDTTEAKATRKFFMIDVNSGEEHVRLVEKNPKECDDDEMDLKLISSKSIDLTFEGQKAWREINMQEATSRATVSSFLDWRTDCKRI